ncbi:MAG: glycosyltransferase family 87 protein [Haloarculaceae archaeon]
MSSVTWLWAQRERRPVFAWATLLTLATLLAYPFVDFLLRNAGVASEFTFRDYGAYHGAVNRWLEGGTIYQERDDGGFHGTYLYPPVVLFLFWPVVTSLDFRAGAMVWMVASVALLWVGLQVLVRALGYDLRWYERAGLLWLMAGFHPLLLGVKLGQTAALQAGLLCLAGAAMIGDTTADRRAWASGALTALVGVVKPAYAPVGAHLLRDARRMKAALVTGLGALWVSVRAFGVDVHSTYLAVLWWGVQKGSDARPPGLWLPPYYKPLSWLPVALAVRLVACLAVVALAVRSDPAARKHVFALGVAAFPLLTPTTYTYYLTALLPAFLVLFAGELERDGYPAVPVLALLSVSLHSYGLKFVVDVLPNLTPFFGGLRPAFPLFQPGLWGNTVLVALAAVRVAEHVDALGAVLPRGDENEDPA